MLRERLFSGLSFCALAVGAFAADVWLFHTDLAFIAVWMLGTGLVLREFYSLVAGMSPFRGYGIACGVGLVLLTRLALGGPLAQVFSPEVEQALAPHLVPAGLVLAVSGTLFLQALKRDNDRAFEAISSTLFGLLYVWFLPSFALALRHLGGGGPEAGFSLSASLGRFYGGVAAGAADPGWLVTGTWLVVALIATAKFTDVAAYFGGRFLGRHKLIPRISPKKTWEGALAGLLGGMAAAVLIAELALSRLTDGRFGLVAALVFGAVVSAVGQLGDLAESLLKRRGGLKDSGSSIPGYGGLFDVVDSLILAAPAAYFLALAIL